MHVHEMQPTTKASLATWSLGYVIAALVVFLKLYTRIKYVNGLEVDDYFAIITLVIFTAGMGVIYTMLVLGLQESEILWLLLPREQLVLLFRCFFISVQLYTLGILFSKLTLIYLYKRIVKSSQILPGLNVFLNCLVWICVFFTSVGIILNFLWCRPIYYFWTPNPIFPQSPQFCSVKLVKASVYMYSTYNMLTDICIIIVPFFFLSRAAIRSRGQRLALFALFGMGTFVIVSTVIKIIAIARQFETPSLVFWSFIEACIAIVVTCLPSLPPLIWKNTNLRDITAAELSVGRWNTMDDIEHTCHSPAPTSVHHYQEEQIQETLEPLPNVYLSKLFSKEEIDMLFVTRNLAREKKNSIASSLSNYKSLRSRTNSSVWA